MDGGAGADPLCLEPVFNGNETDELRVTDHCGCAPARSAGKLMDWRY